MSNIRFAWDGRKAAANRTKHGVTFEEAQTVFLDERARIITDPDHSHDEERFVLLGRSAVSRILIVCHCYRDEDAVIRIISARKATRKEERVYWEHTHEN